MSNGWRHLPAAVSAAMLAASGTTGRRMKLPLIFSFGLLLLGASCSSKTSGQLGMPAPPLQVAHWVRGQPVDLAAARGRNVVVVEFWATWCPPCRASIPHLTELQQKFKERGVQLVGVSNEPLETVRPFVAQMGDKMNYAVATDDKDKTSAGYMGTFGVDGIPHAFVVDKFGAISWHGHPMAELEQAIEKALAAGSANAAAK